MNSSPSAAGGEHSEPDPQRTESSAESSAESSTASSTDARTRRVIWLLVVASFVVLLNETTMSVALRPIMVSLNIDARTGQWLSTAFMLTMAVVIPVTGFLLQRFSTRACYLGALTSFCVGTLLAALAPGIAVLLVARVIQACGTAVMLPLLMTTLMNLVAPAERGKMMGNVSMVISVAPAAGPMLAGVLLDTAGWRGIFWFMLPIGLAMLAIGARLVENVSEPRPVPIDLLSVLLSLLGFGGLVYGLSLVGDHSSTVTMIIALLTGVLGVLSFAARQLRLQRRDEALLDLRTFTYRQFSIGLGIMAALMGSLFGVIIVLPIYLQVVLALSPVTVGLLLLPGGILMGLLAQVVGRLYDRFGPRVLVIPGAAVTSLVMWSLTTVSQSTPTWFVLAAHVVLSVALAFVFTPLFTSVLGAVPASLYSHASAMVGTLQQVAGAAGTALFITIMAARTTSLRSTGLNEVAATAGGVRGAFLAGAVLSLLPLALAFGVRKPAADPGPPVEKTLDAA